MADLRVAGNLADAPPLRVSSIMVGAFYSKETMQMNGQDRSNIRPGMKVRVVEKQNQRSGALTEGVVQRLLTKSPNHPHGIKVMLESGIVGRVKEILP